MNGLENKNVKREFVAVLTFGVLEYRTILPKPQRTWEIALPFNSIRFNNSLGMAYNKDTSSMSFLTLKFEATSKIVSDECRDIYRFDLTEIWES